MFRGLFDKVNIDGKSLLFLITFLQEGKSSEDRFYKSAGHVVLGVVFVSDLGGNYRNFETDEDIGAQELGLAINLGGEIVKS